MTDQFSKKVLFISPMPPPSGGIASWMKKIISYGLPGDYAPCLVDIRLQGNRRVFEKTTFSVTELRRTASILKSLIYQLVHVRPQVVHLNCSLSSVGVFRDLICAVLVRLWRIPLVSHYHGDVSNFSQQRFAGFSFRALRLLVRLSQVNITLNVDSFARISSVVQDYERKLTVLIPNFIEDHIFKYRAKGRQTLETRPRALFVGGVTAAKGCYEILSVAKQMPEVDFDLIGTVTNDMKLSLQALPDNVTIYGAMDHMAVIHEMCSSDLLLFPSHSEGFPNVVLEAMSVGLPVVATRVGAIPEMIEEGKGGFLVNRGDVDGLIQAIHALTTDQTLRTSMGNFNREKSRIHYAYSVIVPRLTALYELVS